MLLLLEQVTLKREMLKRRVLPQVCPEPLNLETPFFAILIQGKACPRQEERDTVMPGN